MLVMLQDARKLCLLPPLCFCGHLWSGHPFTQPTLAVPCMNMPSSPVGLCSIVQENPNHPRCCWLGAGQGRGKTGVPRGKTPSESLFPRHIWRNRGHRPVWGCLSACRGEKPAQAFLGAVPWESSPYLHRGAA